MLAGEAEPAAKVEAIAVVAGRGRDALPLLTPLTRPTEPAIAAAATEAIAEIERRQAMWASAQNVWFGALARLGAAARGGRASPSPSG